MQNGIFLRNVVAAAICLAGSITAFAQETGVEIDGLTWATRNVDAPGTFAATPESYGMQYQWNSKIGWIFIDDGIVPSDGTTVFNDEWDGGGAIVWAAANDPCPAGWRVPTDEELSSLGDGEWTGNGLVFGSGENTIFLPVANYIETDGTSTYLWGDYWSATTDLDYPNTNIAYLLDFGEDGDVYQGMTYEYVNRVFSVRCVKNSNDGVNDISAETENASVAGYYDLLGKKLNEEPTKGIYFLLYDNGKTKKMMK